MVSDQFMEQVLQLRECLWTGTLLLPVVSHQCLYAAPGLQARLDAIDLALRTNTVKCLYHIEWFARTSERLSQPLAQKAFMC